MTKIEQLRAQFQKYQLNGYLVSTMDEYLSEYAPASAKRLEYISGFSGSNGWLIIREQGKNLFFTDGRYLAQAEIQLGGECLIFDQKLLTNFNWQEFFLAETVIGFDPKLFSEAALKLFKNLTLKPLKENLIDIIWENRPEPSKAKIYNYDIQFCGETYESKITRCREFIKQHEACSLLVTKPEAVCWLLNIRSHDQEFAPLLLAHALVTLDEVYLLADINRVEQSILDRNDITIAPEASLEKLLKEQEGKILFDSTLCNKYISDFLKQLMNAETVANPCLLWKACKNEIEINQMIQAHIEDGVAVCEFLALLAQGAMANYSEYELGIKLTELRSSRKGYIMDSFPSIIGFQENSAIIHYRAAVDTAKKIAGEGVILVDSGGQYHGATTDITRTLVMGKPSDEHIACYTRVLKGHLNLAMAKFPVNSVSGANLDVLARQFLWQSGQDYPHGTGHGVGSFLNVHESPPNISLNSHQHKFANGMVVSNEPGFYQNGKFGIRIENMVYVKFSEFPDFLEFANLTMVPYTKDLIDWNLITPQELAFIKSYYREIKDKIMPLLSENGKKWLSYELSF